MTETYAMRGVKSTLALILATLVLVMPALPAFATNCSPSRTWQTGDALTAGDLNTSFTAVATTNMTPACLGDYSANQTESETATDPNSTGSISLATSMAGELERLRYVIQHRTGASAWWKQYEDFNVGNRQLRVHLTTTTGYKELFRGEVHLSSASTRFHVFSISTTEYVPGAAHPE